MPSAADPDLLEEGASDGVEGGDVCAPQSHEVVVEARESPLWQQGQRLLAQLPLQAGFFFGGGWQRGKGGGCSKQG